MAAYGLQKGAIAKEVKGKEGEIKDHYRWRGRKGRHF